MVRSRHHRIDCSDHLGGEPRLTALPRFKLTIKWRPISGIMRRSVFARPICGPSVSVANTFSTLFLVLQRCQIFVRGLSAEEHKMARATAS
jgi:hypothetical protein